MKLFVNISVGVVVGSFFGIGFYITTPDLALAQAVGLITGWITYLDLKNTNTR